MNHLFDNLPRIDDAAIIAVANALRGRRALLMNHLFDNLPGVDDPAIIAVANALRAVVAIS